ncbi:MAG TPA: hypothetical protein VFZ53_09230 [Polyangiaceae bacterium]
MSRIVLSLVFFALAVGACSVKSLPQGTPPPEYETRSFDAWPQAPADAGASAEPTTAPEPPPAAPATPDASTPDGAPGLVDAAAP